MRLATLLCGLIVMVGPVSAQDTNFSVGPQYLITTDSPMFLHSIATPSLSFETPLPGIPSLPQIGPSVEDQSFAANPELQHEADLFPIYYGYPMPSVVEITSAELPRELPASITDTGVTGLATAQSLGEFGYGMPLGDTAAFWKAHRRPAARVYTNADVQHLHAS